DYNPEQWPRETWDEDIRLMREAGVNLVSIGIFSWVMLEPREGEYDFAWLDELIDLLHANGIRVDLGTPTASPPAWFFHKYPEARVVTKTGTIMGFGSRGMAAPSSPEYRRAAVNIATQLAERYGDHPALALWHVHNEYGAPVGEDFSIHAQRAWTAWLKQRYSTLDALNAAWGTRFWGQVYGQWEEVGVPAASPSVINPAQRLDYARFTDAMLRECFTAERDAIREHSSLPVTTNFMAVACPATDLFAWGKAVDIVSNDHYLWAADPRNYVTLALAADLTRSVAGGKPWMLLEHSTSGVNWQPRNVAKRPGEELRNAMSHLGRGADAIMFFQWRASRSGAEKFHSAMLPHGGTNTRIWREVVDLGARLNKLAPVRGSRTVADVALLWDQESFWAQDLEWRPSEDVQHGERMQTFYDRIWRDGLTVDLAHPSQDLSGYKLVVAPASYLLTAASAENLTRYVEGGGTLLVSFFSGIVDQDDRVHEGGFMAPLRRALGVGVEEFLPLRENETLAVIGLDAANPAAHTTGTVWADALIVDGADVIATYVDGPAPEAPAITRNSLGSGHGWYLSTLLDVDGLAPLMQRVYADAGLTPANLPGDVEVLRRAADNGDSYLVAINHTADPVTVPTADGDASASVVTDLDNGQTVGSTVEVPAGGVRVLHITR
ncbi:MAG: beta-galactosidase, partial [Cellulomonadaceae bacterium]|nr:beta-galactosidase [Cellulomonadaceae bacterium]